MTTGRFALAFVALSAVMLIDAVAAQAETTFVLRIRNVSEANTMALSDGTREAALLSWGVYAIHDSGTPIFTPGQAAGGAGLEPLAEDGVADQLAESLRSAAGVKTAGVLKARLVDGVPVIPAGGLMRAVAKANPGDRLSFAVMLEQSNDLFYAFAETGVPLFDDSGAPISADLTPQIMLWDAGTEVNQDPGLGPDTGNNEQELNQGPDEGGVVRLVDDGFTYPAIANVIKLTVEPRE